MLGFVDVVIVLAVQGEVSRLVGSLGVLYIVIDDLIMQLICFLKFRMLETPLLDCNTQRDFTGEGAEFFRGNSLLLLHKFY